MPWKNEASVVTQKGKDYWRTWFLDECEESELFGLNEKHLPLVTKNIPGIQVAYKEGTEIYLEDAPYFNKVKTHHRICGPYFIKESKVSTEAKIIHEVNGKVIIYKEIRPSAGPWLDKSYIRRIVDGVELKYKQLAREFSYFPYRFSIKKSPKYKVQHVKHEYGCWLCVK
jgi:hypothetical protein